MTLQLLTSLHFGIQRELLPAIEESFGPLGEKDRQFIRVCEVLRLEKLLTTCEWKGIGRRPKSRLKMAHAFIAKALWNIPDTKSLISQRKANTTLRRLCGWEEGPGGVPDESTFCRAFATFARLGLGSRAHEELIATHLGETIIREHSQRQGSVPIIEARDYRSAEAVPMEPDRAIHYKARSGVERVNSDLKDNHGGRFLVNSWFFRAGF